MVREVALAALVPADAEVAHQVARGHDRLRLEEHPWGGDPHQRAEGLQQLVDLRLVLAVRPDPLPQERHGVEAQHVDADVRQLEHDLGHRGEDGRVRVVEIPLVGVERRPHPAVELGHPAEAPGRGVREDVGQRARVGVGLRPVGERAVEGQLGGVAGERGLGPRVLARGVVDHQVDAQRHPGGAQLGGQRTQVVHRPQRRVDGPVVGHRVAAVVGLRAAAQQRHQVQIADAQLLQVGHARAHAVERPGEAVDVTHVADGVLAVQPVGGDLALVVEPPQLGLAGGRGAAERPQQRGPLRLEARVVPVQGDERLEQLGEEALEARVERRVAVHDRQRPLVLRPDLGAHGMDVLHARAGSQARRRPF